MKKFKRFLFRSLALGIVSIQVLSPLTIVANTTNSGDLLLQMENAQLELDNLYEEFISEYKSASSSSNTFKKPYNLVGKLGSYMIVLNSEFGDNPLEIPSRYLDYMNEMCTKTNEHFSGLADLTAVSDISNLYLKVSELLTFLDNARIQLMNDLNALKDNPVESHNYLINNNDNFYNVLNSLKLMHSYSKRYPIQANNTTWIPISNDKITSINKDLDILSELYFDLNQNFGGEESKNKLDVSSIETMKDLIEDTNDVAGEKDLSSIYLSGFALSSTYIPFSTNLYNEKTYYPMFDELDTKGANLIKGFTSYRKPVYGLIGDNVVPETLGGKEIINAKPITLRQFVNCYGKDPTQIVLTLKDDSLDGKTYNSTTTITNQISSGSKQHTSNNNETGNGVQDESTSQDNLQQKPEGKEETVTTTADTTYSNSRDTGKFLQPIFYSGLVKDGEIKSDKTISSKDDKDYLTRDQNYVRASNFNYSVMYNIVNGSNISSEVEKDMDEPLFVDMFGNICSLSGYVVVPSVVNASYYSSCLTTYRGDGNEGNIYGNFIFPENATFRIAYPALSNFSGTITGIEDNFANRYMFATTYGDLDKNVSIHNLNYYAKFLDSADLKPRRKSWLKSEKVLSTTKPLNYPTFPIYPYVLNKNELVQLYNKGNFLALQSKRQWITFNRVDEKQQYILNLPNSKLSTGNGKYESINNVMFSDDLITSVYNLNKAYLVMGNKLTMGADKISSDTAKHNGTLKTDLMKTIALQVENGSQDPMQMLAGEDYSIDLNAKSGDNGMLTSMIAGMGESMHFSLYNNEYVGSMIYTPKIDELPILDRLTILLKPYISIIMVIGIFALIISWRPLGFIHSGVDLIIKVGLYFLIVLTTFKLFPTFIDYAMNEPVKKLYKDSTLTTVLLEREGSEKNLKTNYFKGFDEVDTSQRQSYVVLADLNMFQYRQLYEMATGGDFYSDFGFISYFDKVNPIRLSSHIYMVGNKICMTIDTILESSVIKAYNTEVLSPLNTSSYITPELKQYWYEPTELHYFTPYHLITENYIHLLNTLATTTNTRTFPLTYPNGFKITGFSRNFLKSNYYLKTPNERMVIKQQLVDEFSQALNENVTEDDETDTQVQVTDPTFVKKSAEYYSEIIRILNVLDKEFRTNQDFLGIMKWSGLHTSGASERPFGKNVVDNISIEMGLTEENNEDAEENEEDTEEAPETVPDETLDTVIGSGVNVSLTHDMGNVENAYWYNNKFFTEARNYLQRTHDKSKWSEDEIDCLVNGIHVTKHQPAYFVDGTSYISPQLITDNVPDTSATDQSTSDGKYYIYSEDVVVEVDLTNKSNGTVPLYSNGALVGDVKYIERNGQLQLETSALATALGADLYWNGDYKIPMLFFPTASQYGPVGQMYEKVVEVNNQTKEYLNTIYPLMLTLSDENIIKVTALNAVMNFNKEFSTASKPLYPQSLELDGINLDVFLKQLLIPDESIARSAKSNSLYYEIASSTGALGVALLGLFELTLLVSNILRDALITIHWFCLPIIFLGTYVFRNRFMNKAWQGTSLSFLLLACVNFIQMILFLIPSALTSTSTSGTLGAIAIGMLIACLGIFGYGTLLYFLFKDFANLGANTIKAKLANNLNKMMGKLHVLDRKRKGKQETASEDGIVSSRLDGGDFSPIKSYRTLERYQSDIDKYSQTTTNDTFNLNGLHAQDGVVSSRLDVSEEVASGKTIAETVREQATVADVSGKSHISRIKPIAYSDLSVQGSAVSDRQFAELNQRSTLVKGKDYHEVGGTKFITNNEVISSNNLPMMYTVTAPRTKQLIKTLNEYDTPYDVENGQVKYLSTKADGIMDNTTFDEGSVTVPKNAVNTAKQFMKDNNIEYKRHGSTFEFDQTKQDFVREHLPKLTQPFVVQSNKELQGTRTEEGVVLSPDRMLKEARKLESKINKIESKHGRVNLNKVNSKKIEKVFGKEGEVYMYKLSLGDNQATIPLNKDFADIASRIQETVSSDKSLTVRTNSSVNVMFKSKEDYENFKHKFTRETAKYFTTPAVYEDANKVTVYTVQGSEIKTQVMTPEEFSASDYKLGNYKKLN